MEKIPKDSRVERFKVLEVERDNLGMVSNLKSSLSEPFKEKDALNTRIR